MTDKAAAAKDWLNRNYSKHEEIQALRMKLEDMRAGSVKAVSVPEADKVQTQPDPKSGENYILAIVTFEEMVSQKERQLHLSDLETARTIDLVPDPIQRAILIYRYLSYQHWNHISKVMGYSEGHLFKLHEDALEAIADKINYTVT